MSRTFRVPLLGALLLVLAAALAVSLVPAGLALDRRVEGGLRSAAIEGLARAPMILEDRNAARAEALTMHAMSVAGTAGLAEALSDGDFDAAIQLARGAAEAYGEEPVLVASDGSTLVGPTLGPGVVGALRGGGSLVEHVFVDGAPRAIGLMGLAGDRGWVGAAGSASTLAEGLATSLAALARADVTISGADGAVVATTLPEGAGEALVAAEANARGLADAADVLEVDVAGASMWVTRGDLSGAGTVLFSRSVEEELAALPAVRRSALLAGLLTMVLALGVGTLVASALTRPVRGLAEAAGRIAEGDFESPVPVSRVDEVDRLGVAFRSMRAALKGRLRELSEANAELEAKQRRLHELQAELIRQDRVASSGRIAAELAHEIRNPVANVRNCLEVVRRGLPQGSESERFAEMAIDELLRMHELAEHLLDLNRPAGSEVSDANARDVAMQVAALAGVGEEAVPVRVHVEGDDPWAAIPPDSLKQILFNLVENAREAAGTELPVEVNIKGADRRIVVEVLDRGPGIEEDVLPNVFDPFVSTKDAVTGVGLGLSVAQGLARRHGGRIEAFNRTDGPGARFEVEIPASSEVST